MIFSHYGTYLVQLFIFSIVSCSFPIASSILVLSPMMAVLSTKVTVVASLQGYMSLVYSKYRNCHNTLPWGNQLILLLNLNNWCFNSDCLLEVYDLRTWLNCNKNLSAVYIQVRCNRLYQNVMPTKVFFSLLMLSQGYYIQYNFSLFIPGHFTLFCGSLYPVQTTNLC